MIRRITLINFMSHTNTVIEPADGLTVLVGQNNCGKSAIVTALQILCGNTRGDFMVRHGERECVIAVETDDSHVIEWRRRGDTVSYRLNGRDVHRLQGSVPNELHQLLRLPLVLAEGGDFDIHFGEQKKPIFLLNEPASRRATFFASSSDTAKLIEMQNVHRRKIQDAKAREGDFIRREAKLSARLEALSSLDDTGELLIELETCYQATTDGIQSISEIQQLTQDVVNSTQVVEEWTAKTSTLKMLASPPVISDTARLSDTITGIISTHSQVASNVALVGAYSQMSTPPQLANTSAFADAIRENAILDGSVQLLRERQSILSVLTAPPDIVATNRLTATIRDIKEADNDRAARHELNEILQVRAAPPPIVGNTPIRQQIDLQMSAAHSVAVHRAGSECLANLPLPPSIVDVSELACTIDRIVGALEQFTGTKLSARKSRELLADAEHELLNRAKELGTCPVCGQEFDSEKLVAGAVLHSGEQS